MVRTPRRLSTNESAFAKVVTVVLAVLLMGAGVGSFASPALAQNASGGALGINVIGYGEASAPAEMATLQFVIMLEDFCGP